MRHSHTQIAYMIIAWLLLPLAAVCLSGCHHERGHAGDGSRHSVGAYRVICIESAREVAELRVWAHEPVSAPCSFFGVYSLSWLDAEGQRRKDVNSCGEMRLTSDFVMQGDIGGARLLLHTGSGIGFLLPSESSAKGGFGPVEQPVRKVLRLQGHARVVGNRDRPYRK